MGDYPRERTHPAWTPRSVSEHNNTMTVRMRESILGTTAGVSGAAVLVQTADFYRGSLDPIDPEENFGNLNYQTTSATGILVSQKFATA